MYKEILLLYSKKEEDIIAIIWMYKVPDLTECGYTISVTTDIYL